jgi:hypothetical protein
MGNPNGLSARTFEVWQLYALGVIDTAARRQDVEKILGHLRSFTERPATQTISLD